MADDTDRLDDRLNQLGPSSPVPDYRELWTTVESVWADTVTQAARLPESAAQLRVNGEWSFVETLRHLVFATDAWAGRAILGVEWPYHRFGITQSEYTPPAELGLDPAARPDRAEVLPVRADRQRVVRDLLAGLTDVDLERSWIHPPVPDFSGESMTVRAALWFLLHEEISHHRYAARDLAILLDQSPGADRRR